MSENKEQAKAEHYFEQALMYYNSGRLAEAIMTIQDAILMRPSFHEAWNNRGIFLQTLGNSFDAFLCHEKAASIMPIADYYCNTASALLNLEQFTGAEEQAKIALKLKPDFPEAEVNLGHVYKHWGRIEKAIPHYRRAAELNPDYSTARLNLSFALLMDGQYKEGWKEYESRWNSKQIPDRGLKIPAWKGEKGAKVLLYGEQGYGDVLQFMRYGTVLAEKYDCEVWLEVRQPLKRVAETVPGVKGVIALGDPIPQVDFCLPMLSAPRVCGTDTLEDVPAGIPYIKIPDGRDAAPLWESRLERLGPGFRVGICWAGQNREGSPIASAIDARRSTTLQSLAPLGLIPGIKWVCLQRGKPVEQLRDPPHGMTIFDPDDDISDFWDTACLMKRLDLVITVDTAVVHLAGALGVPTWMMSRFDNCWRWLGRRKDSPWYPTVSQFIQPKMGDWESMILEVRDALKLLVACKNRS